MSDWTSGYVADIGYTYGYYSELNPLRASFALTSAGYGPPKSGHHCELGFGQGLSVNMHAAASGQAWWGTDFNPAQAAFAQELAQASGAQAHLTDEAFADFCARSDLPDFDSIGLHGIWSWINDDNRAVIVDFIRRKLKVGGVLYISYNTQPGWAAMVPLRDLLTEHAAVMGSPGQGILGRIDQSMQFAERLMASNPAYARANPQAEQRLKMLKNQNRQYLAHEYFNRDWWPMSFSRMAQWMDGCKLGYVCSAHFIDHIDALNLTQAQQELLKSVPDEGFKQTVRDFCVNQQFRRDYWVKGARRLQAVQQQALLQSQQLVLVSPVAQVNLKVTGAQGEASMQEAVYRPLLEAMASHQPMSLGQLSHAVAAKVPKPAVLQAVQVLLGKGDVALAQDAERTATAQGTTRALNRHLRQLAVGSGDVQYQASPVTGGGVVVNRMQQLFLQAMDQGATQPLLWAMHAWKVLDQQGQRLVKDGVTMQDPESNQKELLQQAQEFADQRLPILRALQVV